MVLYTNCALRALALAEHRLREREHVALVVLALHFPQPRRVGAVVRVEVGT